MNTPSSIPLTVLAPYSLDSMKPLEIIDEDSNLKAAFVERYAIEHVTNDWKSNACGFYILFSHLRADHTFDVYVGRTSANFLRRLRSHDEQKDYWNTALLVQKNNNQGFTSTQSGYLEGRMRDILDISANVTVHNSAPTGDATIAEHEKYLMEKVILSTLRMMFLRGYRNASMANVADKITHELVARPVIPPTSVIEAAPVSAPRFSLWGKSKAKAKPQPVVQVAEVNWKDTLLGKQLRAWRKQQTQITGHAAYFIMKDESIDYIVKHRPATIKELHRTTSLKDSVVKEHGEVLLLIISKFQGM